MILSYAQLEEKHLGDVYSSKIGINQKGERLEYFVKDLLCGSIDATSKEQKDTEHAKHLSWTGQQNHPPDLMIRQFEAIEVKSSQGKHPTIPLNSSPPRQKIRSDTLRISDECRKCEDDVGGWGEKDVVYAIGSRVTKNKLGFMWMVYGDCWCADDNSYLDISDTITEKAEMGLEEIDHIEFDGSNNEIGKVRKADPLGRTKLRIRGMWSLDHPAKYFSQYVDEYDRKIEEEQPLFTVMRKSRYEDFPDSKRTTLENSDGVTVTPIQVPAPDNPDDVLGCILIEAI